MKFSSHPPYNKVMNQEKKIIHASFESVEESHFLELAGSTHCSVWIRKSVTEESSDKIPAGLLPGSFNPLHEGHRKLKSVAEEILEHSVDYEISLQNVEKPEIDYASLVDRISQFSESSVILNNAPTFIRKAELYPGVAFIVGMDTAIRILDSRFYNDDEELMIHSLLKLRDSDSKFLVAAREVDQQILELDDLEIPSVLKDLFIAIPREQFHHDISSSVLRRKNDQNE